MNTLELESRSFDGQPDISSYDPYAQVDSWWIVPRTNQIEQDPQAAQLAAELLAQMEFQILINPEG